MSTMAASSATGSTNAATCSTQILPIHSLSKISPGQSIPDFWTSVKDNGSSEVTSIQTAAKALLETDTPVAFPTETVYGLAADATRSAAVRGIYKAKQRPSDNPLIVHVWSIEHLRTFLRASSPPKTENEDPIPQIYHPLISRFWPGPLTIILPNPNPSPLAQEVTSTLPTFGVRVPSSPLARLLIYLTDRPLAAPSANASTKPSPTTAQHVMTDLEGRIEYILDGGACSVGVESTVVDGLSSPPAILRPGGIGIEEIRACPGWEDVQVGYKDGALKSKEAPRAPGMKYKHYSPKATVVLFEAGATAEAAVEKVREEVLGREQSGERSIGVLRTRCWSKQLGLSWSEAEAAKESVTNGDSTSSLPINISTSPSGTTLYDVDLGRSADEVARNLFAALRAVDDRGAQTIFVEGISDSEGDLAAAVMNRLRKAAEVEVKSA